MLCPLKQAALDAGSQCAVIDPSQKWTFAALNAKADQATASLETLGIQPGDVVALIHPPCIEWIALFFALLRLGATLFPIHLRWPPSAIEFLIKEVKPKCTLHSSELFALFSSSQQSQQDEVSPQAPALYIMTSGSSGTAKIALLSLVNLLTSALSANELLQVRPDDVWFLSLPLYHVGGIGVLFRTLLARATVLLNPAHIQQATHISYVPTQLYRLKETSLPKLRALLIGGAPLSCALYQAYRHLPLFVSYGMTEMSSLIVATSTPLWKQGLSFLGAPLRDREVRVNAEGEIQVKGKTLFLGYWKRDPSFDTEGWFATNDLGQYDAQAGLAVVGRKDWQFISGGEKIQPEEIEQCLLQSPDIEEAVVVPKADPEFGFRPVLFARASHPSWDFQTMRNQLKSCLPSYKIPVALYPLEPLPPNVLKRDRRALINKVSST